jgi:hypothetical protein
VRRRYEGDPVSVTCASRIFAVVAVVTALRPGPIGLGRQARNQVAAASDHTVSNSSRVSENMIRAPALV